MKQFVKTLVAITAILLFSISSFSQLRLTPRSGISSDVKKIIEDHPYHFSHITGPLILENAQFSDYECNFDVTGAEESTITKYSSKTDNVSSWKAIMLTTESFEEAKKKFKSLYGQLNGLSVRSAKLTGVYETPVEEKDFTSVIFSFDAKDEGFQKLKVELVLYTESLEWKVKLMIYDREREDAERGKIVED
jgi:hypothetical protein